MKTATICDRINYHYDQTVGAPVPPIEELVELTDNSDGEGIQFKWLTSFTATKAELLAYDNDTVTIWVENAEDTVIADFDKWTVREKALIKFVVTEINKLRTQAGGNVLTKNDVKTGLKLELDTIS